MNKPTVGRIVMYNTTEQDRAKMKALSCLGKGCNEQKQLPAIIVAVWGPECVNLKVMLDGHGDLWKTSAGMGDHEGGWSWPVKE